jgi:hypothetical protein
MAGSEGRKEQKLELGDLVWMHLIKDRLPELHKSKLIPRVASPYNIIEKLNDNAYINLSHHPSLGLVPPLTLQI